jgi:hypothetical protein
VAVSNPSRTPEEWQQIASEAILDLLRDLHASPWAEIEARIAVRGWKAFEKAQPVQLSGARRALRADGLILEDESNHAASSVRMLRLPPREGLKRLQEREAGRRRKLYRKFLSWTADGRLCGKHAERVVLDSLKAAASDAGLFVPPQTVGEISSIEGIDLTGSPLDCYAHILNTHSVTRAAVAVFEVKNIHQWIYPDAEELWQLLLAAAPIAAEHPVVPVLVCVRYAYPVLRMAMDMGFFVCSLYDQLFSLEIDPDEFDAVFNEFDLLMRRHEGPSEPVVSFLTKTLRRSPPQSPPVEKVEWFRRQAERFATIAPVVESHPALASPLSAEARRKVFKSFATNASRAATWPLQRGWS